ncbi:MAG: PHB depolymerase family esterase [Myxococcota bacterium]
MPPDYDPARAWPLVLLLHGYSASGAIQDLYLGFSDTAKAAGFITVIPDGLKNALGNQYWNASPGWCCDFEHSGVDDDGYLVGLVAEAKARWHVDPTRVFAFGHSNGGFMAHELACHHADLFAAIASLAGSLPIAVNDCNPSQPVSVLQIHGTLDAVIVYPGNADYPGAEAVVDRWASYDECSGQRVAGDPRDYDSAVAGLEATPWAWASCASDTEVALWSLAGSGHIPVVLGGPMIGDALGWFLTHPKTAPPAR